MMTNYFNLTKSVFNFMTKAAAVFIFCFVFSSYSFAAQYSVNFKNVPIKDFITFVSEFTGKNVIFNENDIKGNITVSSQKEMNEKEVLNIFYSVMKMNGYIPITKGNNIQIVAEKDTPAYDESMVIKGKAPDESFVISVISLSNYSAAQILPVLNRIKSRMGYVELIKGLNILLIKDQSSRIAKMTELINMLENKAGEYVFHNIPLKYVLASKVEHQINKMYIEMNKNAISTMTPVLVSDDVSNSLIVGATETEFNRIQYLISKFDTRSTVENTAPRVFYLKHAKAEDVEKVLVKLIGSIAPPKGAQGSVHSIKTSISSDKATNSIIVMGDQEIYTNISILIEKMDIPRRQVYVESLILETSLDRTHQFGVDWYGGKDFDREKGVVIGGSNTGAGLPGLVNSAVNSGNPSFTPGFSLGVIGNIISYNGMKFPTIGAFLSAITGTSGVSIVSNPQILTLDNEEAEVFVGENRPYLTSEKQDSNNNPIQTYDYRNVGIRLKVTPQISSSDTIVLSLEQEVNKMSESSVSSSAPITLNRTTKTVVKLQNRSVLVISGLIKNDTTTSDSGVPFLSKIPVLGWLFKSRSFQNEKTNLMVFISASIIDTVEDAENLMKKREESLNKFNIEADKALKSKIFSGMQNEIDMLNRNEKSGGKNLDSIPADVIIDATALSKDKKSE